MNGLKDTYTLNNGVRIPCIGFGTFRTPDGDTAVNSVKEALRCGYRHIDTAAIYGNEEGVGNGIRAAMAEYGIERDEIFITSKLWNDRQGYDSTLKAFNETMARLGFETLDLYLIHWPSVRLYGNRREEYNLDTWRAFERLYRDGRIRAIGLSNFLPHHIKPILEACEIRPAVDQLELHPQHQQKETVEYCRANGILAESWGPLIQGKAFSLPLLNDIAAKYNRTVAQVCIRWALQKGILPLPKSVTPSRIESNAWVFDFELTAEDMALIDALEGTGGPHTNPDTF